MKFFVQASLDMPIHFDFCFRLMLQSGCTN
jgi:hypothetical protein